MQVPSRKSFFNLFITLRLHANVIALRKSSGLIRKLSVDTFLYAVPSAGEKRGRLSEVDADSEPASKRKKGSP